MSHTALTDQLGGLYACRIMHIPFVVVTDPALAHEVGWSAQQRLWHATCSVTARLQGAAADLEKQQRVQAVHSGACCGRHEIILLPLAFVSERLQLGKPEGVMGTARSQWVCHGFADDPSPQHAPAPVQVLGHTRNLPKSAAVFRMFNTVGSVVVPVCAPMRCLH